MNNMLKNKEQIKSWLKGMLIRSYTIKDDLTVDVAGDVYLNHKSLQTIPVQFGHVEGVFNCTDNQLVNLKGSPHTVEVNFYCCNNKLNTIEHGPQTVGGLFDCSNNQLTTLEFCPQKVGRNFDCSYNQLTSLKIKNLPLEINGKFHLQQDLKLPELESLYNDDGWVSCDLATLKRTLNAFEFNQSLRSQLPIKANTKKVKV